IATGILLSFVIFLNVTLYRFGHVVNYFNNLLPSSNQADTLPSTEVVSSNENELIFPNELTTWLTDNVANTGIGFSVSAEAFSRPNSDVTNEDVSYDLNNLDEELNNQRSAFIASQN